MSFGGHGLNMKQALLPLPTVVTKISFGALGLHKKQAPTVVKPIKVDHDAKILKLFSLDQLPSPRSS